MKTDAAISEGLIRDVVEWDVRNRWKAVMEKEKKTHGEWENLPAFILLPLLIIADSKGGVFYRQVCVFSGFVESLETVKKRSHLLK